MKKSVLISALLAVAGCASQNPQEPEVYAEAPSVSVPCSYSCMENNCLSAVPEPLVLKPRVTETVSAHKKRRCCPDDVVVGSDEQQVIVPDLPEIYVISANRTVSSMLNDAKAVFNDKPVHVFVPDSKLLADDLPGGADKGLKAAKKRLDNVNTVILAKNAKTAEYIVNTAIDWFDTPTKQVPAIKYTMELVSSDGVKIGEWTEVVHQTEGDRSWW